MDVTYAYPDYLVTTEWVAAHQEDANVRIVESNEDPLLYPSCHLQGAVQIDWVEDLNDPIRRDYLQAQDFQNLCSRLGIHNETTVVFYGDKSNWWAAYALWVFQLFGHSKVKLMNGGRLKWELEKRPLVKEIPKYSRAQYIASERNDSSHRAFRDQVMRHITQGAPLIDVRSPDEFSGKKLHMDGYPNEGALRGGHIPGAKNIPWAKSIREDGTFKTFEELASLYISEGGFHQSDELLVYCRIGERSSHTWFVLKYLLGFTNVRNYDGSWTEWGNLVGVPIEK